MNSYAVRCIFECPKEEFNELAHLYEERITVWQASDIDTAIDKAVEEAETYAHDQRFSFGGLSQAYWISAAVSLDGTEVFSLMRESDLPIEEYLDWFFSTGNERQSGKKAK